ncbi:MAG: ABC transporter ATP-binding protein [Planctomycetaceae bacterium]|nr:ABC transporter ATP-binding protein [Planctomycetaceae bacterium]
MVAQVNPASAQLGDAKRSTDPAFVLRDVTVQFGQQPPVLKDLSFQVESGQFLALVGPSGCGKSTLLRLFADLLGPVAGTVSRRSDVGAGQIGFVFQQPNLLPWRTGLQNLQLPSELGRSAKEVRSEEELLDLMRQVGLKDSDKDKRPAEMSGGMQMRLSLARALVNEPRILLLDEPFAAVDDLLRMKLQEDVRRIHDERKLTTILVTHNLHEAAYLSDRVLVLSSAPALIRQDLQLERSSMTAEQRRTAEETMRSLQRLTGALFQP